MANIIDAVIRLKDQFTPVLKTVKQGMLDYSKQTERLGKDVTKIGKQIESQGKLLTAGITAPMLAFSGASVKTYKDFDATMTKVGTLSQATKSQLDDVTAHAQKLGETTSFSAIQVGEAMQYMALAGWDSLQMIEGSKGILDASASTGEDLATVCDIITDSLSAFGMVAGESSRMADVLATSSTSANTTISMMGEAFTYVGSVAGAFKYSIEDTALALGLMANSGIKASQAGTALRKIMTETNGAFEVKGENGYTYLIDTVDRATGKMIPFKETIIELRKAFSGLTDAEKILNAEAIAGKTGMAGLLAIVNASQSEFNKLSNAIDNSKDSAAKMSEEMLDNLDGDLKILTSKFETLQIIIGKLLNPKMRETTQRVTELIDKFLKLTPETQKAILKVTALAGVLPVVILVFGKIIKTVGKLITKFGKFGTAIKNAGGVMVALKGVIFAPATIIVASITAIALAGLLIYKYWTPITGFFKSVFNKLKQLLVDCGFDVEKFKEIFNNLKEVIPAAMHNILTVIKAVLKTIAPIFIGVGVAITTVVSGVVGSVVGLLTGALDNIGSIISRVVDLFGGLILFITSVFAGDWANAWQGIVNIFEGIFGGLWEIAKSVINGVIGVINGGIKGVHSVASFFGATKGDAPQIPKLYTGTDNWRGGTAMIHDKGAEIVDLPSGTRVYPHDKSLKMAYENGKQSSKGFSIEKLADTIIVREDADIDRIANALYNKFQKQALNMA